MTQNPGGGSAPGCAEVRQALEFALQAVLQARSLLESMPCACGQCGHNSPPAERAPNWMYGRPPDLL